MTTLVWSGSTAVLTRVSWDNIFRRTGAIVTVSAGDNKEYLYDWRVHRRFSPGAGDITITVVLLSAEAINHFWMLGHNLATDGSTIKGEYWDGSAWQTAFAAVGPSDNKMLWIDFASVVTSQFRVTILGSTAAEIGQIFVGNATNMERGISPGFTPPRRGYATDSTLYTNGGGYPIGRASRLSPFVTRMAIRDLSHEWVRDIFMPFYEHATVYPWALQWSTLYPTETALCWTEETPEAPNYQTSIHMQLSWRINMIWQ